MTSGTKVFEDTRIYNQVSSCGSSGITGVISDKTWTGGDLPVGFDRSAGPLPPHNYTMSARKLVYTPFTFKETSTSAPRSGLHGSCFGDFDDATPNTARVQNLEYKALARLRDNIQGNSFDLSVFLGTSHQSLRTIAEASSKIFFAYVAARHLRFNDAARYLSGELLVSPRHYKLLESRDFFKKSRPLRGNSRYVEEIVADRWLELQYGWLPLLSDIRQGAEQLAFRMGTPKTMRANGSARYKVGPGSSTFTGAQAFYVQWRGFYSIRYVAMFKESGSFLKTTGVLNPENLAWELLPWSFVADWFIPIGNWLELRAFSQRVTGTFVKSVLYERRGKWVPGVQYSISDASEAYRKSLTRTVSSSLSVPRPRFQPLSDDISWRRAANAVALMTQFFH